MHECEKNTKVSDQCERSTLRGFGYIEKMNEDGIAKEQMSQEEEEDCKNCWVELMSSSKRDKCEL